MKTKTCENCKWLYEEHCCNGASDMCTEAVLSDDNCDKWELGGVNVNAIEAVRRQNKKVAFDYLHGKDIAVITLRCEEAQAIIEALGKQIPKKPAKYDSCPNCHQDLFRQFDVCIRCSQNIDWEV